MTKPCAVPKCRTGYKSERKKHSVFRVPKNAERLQKWEEAIPGKIKLRAKDVICDKHFEDRYVRREWIKYDPNDESKIIARAPYKYPQLSEFAVPTRFDENLENEKAVASIMELDAASPSSPIETCVKTLRTPLNCLVSSIPANLGCGARSIDKASVHDDMATNRPPSHENGQMSLAMELEANRSEDSDRFIVECPLPVEHSPDANDVSNDGLFIFEKSEVDPLMEISHDSMPNEKSLTLLSTNAKPYTVVSTVTISENIPKANSTTVEKYSTDIPKSWSATELCVDKKQRIVFQYIVTKRDKGMQIPILQKCVALDENRQLEYFVYGRRVETHGTLLNRTLEEAASLRNTLEMFQRMGTCIGLGVTSKDVPIEDAYVDYVQEWRHNNCSLIARQKRCECCLKLRNRVNARIRNMKTIPALKRIHRTASNTFDHRKVSALLKRNDHERRSRKKAEGRANSLTKKLEKVQEKIAHFEDATLEKKMV